VVAVSHLDTQWRWTIQDTIRRHLPRTLAENFRAIERFPSYVVSFDGAFRYRLIREYYSDQWPRLRAAIAAGRWWPAGRFVDAADVNLPGAEALVRQMLYGGAFFVEEFGVCPPEVFLPDGFGFGFALPTLAAHCGVRGFATQKLSKGRAAAPVPFALGLWRGPDGAGVIAALEPGGYGEKLRSDLSSDPDCRRAVAAQAAASGLPMAYRFFGVGDRGGAPDEESLVWLERSVAGSGPLEVTAAGAGRLFAELGADQLARLPVHRGELLLSVHATGAYTSQAAMKRWNRANEMLADAAERAALVAHWLGGTAYPRTRLRAAWERFLWHQFHDDLTGTSIPAAYAFSWNDELLSLNEFAAELAAAVGTVARALDTRAGGVPLVAFNPLATAREDLVEAKIRFAGGAPPAVRVYAPQGEEVPAQVVCAAGDVADVVFVARLPPTGFAVFDVRPSAAPGPAAAGLAVGENWLAGPSLRAELDAGGDLASLRDLRLAREMLSGPVRLELLADRSTRWPAWEILYRDLAAPPIACVSGPARLRVLERGPARMVLEVSRNGAGSTFVQRYRLGAGDAGSRLEVATFIRWRSRGRLLKVALPFALTAPVATFDLGCGAIEREVATPCLYEVPAQHWADLSGPRDGCGVAVLNDCKHGWDRPRPDTLRLTLLHTPRVGRRFRHQGSQDMGDHKLLYALAPHAGDWRDGDVPLQAARLNRPVRAFQTRPHPGPLGREWSFLGVLGAGVAVQALKLSEAGDEAIVRLQETAGRPARATLAGSALLVAAREVDGGERVLSGESGAVGGHLAVALSPWQPRAYALQLGEPPCRLAPPDCRPLSLPFDLDAVSPDADRGDGDYDGHGRTYPAELWPAEVTCQGMVFRLGPAAAGAANAVVCRGQRLALDAQPGSRLYLLASALGEVRARFQAGGDVVELAVAPWRGFVGQWHRPRWSLGRLGVLGVRPAYLRRDTVAWAGTHTHARHGDEPYVFCYLFKYCLELARGATDLVLPEEPRVRLFAASVAVNPADDTTPAGVLYD
jgi:alpha-mannosidase